MINEEVLEQMREGIIKEAIERKLITRDEWNDEYCKYIDHYGINSFLHYLEAVMYNANAFITECAIMLEKRKSLEKRFGVKILKIEEVMKKYEKK